MSKPPKKQSAVKVESRVKAPMTGQEPEARSTDGGPAPIDAGPPSVDQVETNLEELLLMSDRISKVAQLTDDYHREFGRLIDLFEAKIQSIESERAQLVLREVDVLQAENVAQANFVEERIASERDLSTKRLTALEALEVEVNRLRADHLEAIRTEGQAERNRLTQSLEELRSEFEASLKIERDSFDRQKLEIEIQRGTLSALQTELEGRRVELDESEAEIDRRRQRMREVEADRLTEIEEEVQTRIEEERLTFKARLEAAIANSERIRSQLQTQDELLGAFEDLRRQMGGREPAAVLSQLQTLTEQLARQREELATRPSEEIRLAMDGLEQEKRGLQNRVSELMAARDQRESVIIQANEYKLNNAELNAEIKSLRHQVAIWESQATSSELRIQNLQAELDRYRTPPPEVVEARYEEIEIPRLSWNQIQFETEFVGMELEWLSRVGERCDEHGLHFSPRILKAFHTALKTAEWSPITVLAGVSGTGKSQLPELYSHFGGLYFQSLAVQPNWDSQESMLGYFNSIDNKFDAQPVLRFLAQSQREFVSQDQPGGGYPGLNEAMCLILLDEMNLAHPEMYFAEFLSKLEQRRGSTAGNIPKLDVKVGAGMRPYELPLGRNVLWVGTMNEDETTKSLSDKVLDRATVIYFPRPTKLSSRTELKTLSSENRGLELPRHVWQTWKVNRVSFSDEEIDPYRTFVEKVNHHLSSAGRAVGHRVWQSIEYYMANYPDVLANPGSSQERKKALHTAFEDQIAQKIMPKLRGIDTRGSSRSNCLDPIRALLQDGVDQRPFGLLADFDLSMELGYGQFMWKSADYLKDGEDSGPV